MDWAESTKRKRGTRLWGGHSICPGYTVTTCVINGPRHSDLAVPPMFMIRPRGRYPEMQGGGGEGRGEGARERGIRGEEQGWFLTVAAVRCEGGCDAVFPRPVRWGVGVPVDDGAGDGGASGFPANRLRKPLKSSLVDTRGLFSMSNQNLGGLPVAGEPLLLSSSVASGLLMSVCVSSPLGRGDRRSIGNEGIVRGTRQGPMRSHRTAPRFPPPTAADALTGRQGAGVGESCQHPHRSRQILDSTSTRTTPFRERLNVRWLAMGWRAWTKISV